MCQCQECTGKTALWSLLLRQWLGSVLVRQCLLLLLSADDSPDPAAPTTPTATEGVFRAATGRFDEQENVNLEAWGQFWDQQGVQPRKDMPNAAVRMAHLLGQFSGVLQAKCSNQSKDNSTGLLLRAAVCSGSIALQ